MNENQVKPNSLQAWILAARPKTLSGAAVPVMIGIAMALKDLGADRFQWLPAILCLFFAWIMQIDSNLINDYFDCVKGNDDTATRLGPKRACSEGWITLPAMRIGMAVVTLMGCVVGLPLIYFGGIEMIFVGALCVLFAFLYTTTFSYLGLGDMLVLLFFGVVPVCITYYVIMPEEQQFVSGEVILASIVTGMVIDTLLIVNNYRDRDNDERGGKMTLVVRIGSQATEKVYLWLGIIAYIVMHLMILTDISDNGTGMWWKNLVNVVAVVLIASLHITTWKQMKQINHGRELNRILGQTARNMFIFGLLESASIIIINL